jgi:hypothetical protein
MQVCWPKPFAEGSVSETMRWIDKDARQARERALAMLARLPKVDTKGWLQTSRDLSKRDHPAFGIFTRAVEDFLHKAVSSGGHSTASQQALAELHTALGAKRREVETYNLDGGMAALAILQTLSKALQ